MGPWSVLGMKALGPPSLSLLGRRKLSCTPATSTSLISNLAALHNQPRGGHLHVEEDASPSSHASPRSFEISEETAGTVRSSGMRRAGEKMTTWIHHRGKGKAAGATATTCFEKESTAVGSKKALKVQLSSKSLTSIIDEHPDRTVENSISKQGGDEEGETGEGEEDKSAYVETENAKTKDAGTNKPKAPVGEEEKPTPSKILTNPQVIMDVENSLNQWSKEMTYVTDYNAFAVESNSRIIRICRDAYLKAVKASLLQIPFIHAGSQALENKAMRSKSPDEGEGEESAVSEVSLSLLPGAVNHIKDKSSDDRRNFGDATSGNANPSSGNSSGSASAASNNTHCSRCHTKPFEKRDDRLVEESVREGSTIDRQRGTCNSDREDATTENVGKEREDESEKARRNNGQLQVDEEVRLVILPPSDNDNAPEQG